MQPVCKQQIEGWQEAVLTQFSIYFVVEIGVQSLGNAQFVDTGPVRGKGVLRSQDLTEAYLRVEAKAGVAEAE